MSGDLIARLEAATAPSTELDEEIRVAVGADSISYPPGEGLMTTDDCVGPPEYTASIDAALTLIDPKLFQRLVRDHNRRRTSEQDAPKGARGFASVSRCRGDGPIWSSYGATSAIALCIAALKAREAAR